MRNLPWQAARRLRALIFRSVWPDSCRLHMRNGQSSERVVRGCGVGLWVTEKLRSEARHGPASLLFPLLFLFLLSCPDEHQVLSERKGCSRWQNSQGQSTKVVDAVLCSNKASNKHNLTFVVPVLGQPVPDIQSCPVEKLFLFDYVVLSYNLLFSGKLVCFLHPSGMLMFQTFRRTGKRVCCLFTEGDVQR